MVFLPIIGILVRKASKRMRKLSLQVQDTMGDVNHVVQESISGSAVVKSFAGEESEQSVLSHLKRT